MDCFKPNMVNKNPEEMNQMATRSGVQMEHDFVEPVINLDLRHFV